MPQRKQWTEGRLFGLAIWGSSPSWEEGRHGDQSVMQLVTQKPLSGSRDSWRLGLSSFSFFFFFWSLVVRVGLPTSANQTGVCVCVCVHTSVNQTRRWALPPQTKPDPDSSTQTCPEADRLESSLRGDTTLLEVDINHYKCVCYTNLYILFSHMYIYCIFLVCIY